MHPAQEIRKKQQIVGISKIEGGGAQNIFQPAIRHWARANCRISAFRMKKAEKICGLPKIAHEGRWCDKEIFFSG